MILLSQTRKLVVFAENPFGGVPGHSGQGFVSQDNTSICFSLFGFHVFCTQKNGRNMNKHRYPKYGPVIMDVDLFDESKVP